jgi:hypothetical protein
MSDIKNSSFYDTGQIFKEVHDLHGKTLRVSDSRSVVGQFYTHFRVEYNTDNLPTKVSYFRGTAPHKTNIGCVSDIAGSLNNSYIRIYSAPDNKAYHLWFNVGDTGVAPVIANSTAIEIPINANDDALVIAMAISLVLNSLYKSEFVVTRNSAVVEIATAGFGVVSNSTNHSIGFSLTNVVGKQEVISNIDIGYEGSHPIYKGQVLKNYIFNVFSGQFELKEDLSSSNVEVSWDEISTTFPSDTQELYTYKNNSISVQETLVTYADSTRKQIVSIQKTRL